MDVSSQAHMLAYESGTGPGSTLCLLEILATSVLYICEFREVHQDLEEEKKTSGFFDLFPAWFFAKVCQIENRCGVRSKNSGRAFSGRIAFFLNRQVEESRQILSGLL
jgi:hypothetical protein